MDLDNNWQQEQIKDLVISSLHSITFLRNVFREENYFDQKFCPVSDKNHTRKYVFVKRLRGGVSQKADIFKDWLEIGVEEAFRRKNLKGLQLLIHVIENGLEKVAESYVFQFDTNDSNGELDMSQNLTRESFEKEIECDKMLQLLRNLLVSTQKLGVLPAKKKISLRILLHEVSPNECYASFFRKASDEESCVIKKNPIIHVGAINSSRGSFGMRILSNAEIPSVHKSGTTVKLQDLLVKKEWSCKVEFPETYNLDLPDTYLYSQRGCIPSIFGESEYRQVNNSINEHSIACECNANESIARIKMSTKGYALMNCKCCGRTIHSCCYGLAHSKKIRQFSGNIQCYSCLLGKNDKQLDGDLLLLMRLRYLWKYISSSEMPQHFDFYYKVFHFIKKKDDQKVRQLIGVMFSQSILILLKGPIISKKTGKRVVGTGIICPTISDILDGKRKPLKKNQEVNVSFLPRAKYLPCFAPYSVNENLFFPNKSITKDAVSRTLQDFKKSMQDTLSSSSDEEDPLENNSSDIFSSFQNGDHHNSKSDMLVSFETSTQRKRKSTYDSEDFENFSFNDSLMFLSQTQKGRQPTSGELSPFDDEAAKSKDLVQGHVNYGTGFSKLQKINVEANNDFEAFTRFLSEA